MLAVDKTSYHAFLDIPRDDKTQVPVLNRSIRIPLCMDRLGNGASPDSSARKFSNISQSGKWVEILLANSAHAAILHSHAPSPRRLR